MPVYAKDPLLLNSGEELRPQYSSGQVFGALFGEMSESGMLGSEIRVDELNRADGIYRPTRAEVQFGRPQPERAPLSQMLSPEVARERLRENGLEQNLSIPQNGIREAVLDILVERKQKELQRAWIMENAVPGGMTTFAALAGGLAGSVVDPSNIALAFVPVVGEARYAQLLARAGGVLGRTAVRVGVGSVEGLVGLLPAEAYNYYANQQQQADYDAYDSMMNIASGAIFGSALHAGAGLFGDALTASTRRVRPVADALTLDAPPVQLRPLSPEQVERMMVLDRLAEGKPVTRAQVDAMQPRTGAEAGQVIDDVLFELRQASTAGRLTPDEVNSLVKEADELEALVRESDKTTVKSLTPAERLFADTRRVEIKQALERNGAARSAETRLTSLESKLAKIDDDASIMALADELSPLNADQDFVDSLSPAIRDRLDSDPFMQARMAVARMTPETQAASLRMAIAQAVSGREIDVSPAMLTDPNSFSPPAALAAANANVARVAGASDAASKQGDAVQVGDGSLEELAKMADDERALVEALEKEAGVEMTAADEKELSDADELLKLQKDALEQAKLCLMRTGA